MELKWSSRSSIWSTRAHNSAQSRALGCSGQHSALMIVDVMMVVVATAVVVAAVVVVRSVDKDPLGESIDDGEVPGGRQRSRPFQELFVKTFC